jgi:acyl-CoA thioester hydrolase
MALVGTRTALMSESVTSGELREKIHHFPVRVYYAETDAGGVVYHASYLSYAERARTEMLRLLGFDHVRQREQYGMMWVVRGIEADFRRPAHLDDLLDIRSTLVYLGGASLHVDQAIWRGDEEVAALRVRLACMHIAGRPVRIPAALRQALQEFLKEAD